MEIKEAIEKAKKEIGELTKLKLNTVIGASKDEESGNWNVTVELIEKTSIPDSMDLLGIYEVLVNEKGKVVRFERKGLKKRGDVERREE